MCDVYSWVMVGVALVGGYTDYKSSQNAQAYNEQVAEQGKQVAEAQAVDAERLGQLQANERRLQTRLQIAQQSTGFGAQNVEQTGTAMDILGDTAMFGEIDESRIRANAARQAWGFRMQGYQIESDKRLMQYQGKVHRFGTILSTVGSVAGTAYGGYSGRGGGGLGNPGGSYAGGYGGYTYGGTSSFGNPFGGTMPGRG